MDLPTEVFIYNDQIDYKQRAATLVAVHEEGIYELKVAYPTKSGGQRTHRVLLPVAATGLVFRTPEVEYAEMDLIER